MHNADLLQRFPDARRDGAGWTARCPAHDDHRASLSIGAGDDGRTLLHCHAGCGLDAILAAVNLDAKDLFEPTITAAKSQIVATYRYEDEGGLHLFNVYRRFPKDFRQQRADGAWSTAGVRRVLYRLPELQGQTTVYLVEGEKDTDRLRALGLTASTCPGGAGKWKPEFTQQLQAASVERVVVLPDNDEPGRAHADQVARSCHASGLTVKVVALPNLPAKGDVSDWLATGRTKDALIAIVKGTALFEPSAAQPIASRDLDGDGGVSRGPSQATQLVDLAIGSGLELWHTAAGDAYATIRTDGHREHHPLRRVVRDYLSRLYYVKTGRSAASGALTDAFGTLSGMARYDGPTHQTAVRVAADGDTVYLDLGDPAWRAIAITADGWRVVADAPVRYWRPASLRALPEPTQGGTLDAFRELWPMDDDTWTRVASWQLTTLQPRGPYPILIETGEQGSGKSTLGRMLRGVVDPASPELRGVPRDERDVMIGALTSWIVCLDNLSGLPVSLSDALCRIATGGGLATRTLYSDLDETLIDVMRPILLTGIDSPATRGDLLDRSIVVTLPPIGDDARSEERDLWARYQAMRPSLLGALCDAVSMALRRRDHVRLARRPRMADACRWVTAAEPALGWTDGRTATAWLGARAEASADLIASDVVGQALIGLADRLPWSGTAGELLTLIAGRVTETIRTSRAWPNSPRGLSGALRRLAPDLRRAGIAADLDAREPGTGRRVISIVTTVTPSQQAENRAFLCDGRDGRPEASQPTVTESTPKTGLRDGRDGRDGQKQPLLAEAERFLV